MAQIDTSFLGLNRPQYVSASELLLSELAWSMAPETAKSAGGLAYGSREAQPRTGTTIAKHVYREEELAERLAQTLDNRALAPSVARALLDELEVVAAGKSKRSTAVPATPALALLSNRVGMLGTANPPNLAVILEQMNKLGGSDRSVASQWMQAIDAAGHTGLPSWFEGVTQPLLHELASRGHEELKCRRHDPFPSGARRPLWLHKHGSPCVWFSGSWQTLCSPSWLETMPRRRWTDWATCVARTGLASVFLFEAHLVRTMFTALATERPAADVVAEVFGRAGRLLRWDDGLGPAAVDAQRLVRDLAEKAAACQARLKSLVENEMVPPPSAYDGHEDGLAVWLDDARQQLTLAGHDRATIVFEALETEVPTSAKNVRETILYSLDGRRTGASAGLYGVLRSKGRYRQVDPGQEWLVVVAGLASGEPGRPARLQDLLRSLSMLCIDASISTVVKRLEAYGLCRSSHDADDALEIHPAF